MKLFLVSLFALIVSTLTFAQTAALTADTKELAASGGLVQLVATTTYDNPPSALGWAIELPAGWTLVSVGGANLPAVAPAADASGTLEFAFTSVPTSRTEFSVTVHYPAGVPAAAVGATAYLRADGKLTTLAPAKVPFRRRLPEPELPQKN